MQNIIKLYLFILTPSQIFVCADLPHAFPVVAGDTSATYNGGRPESGIMIGHHDWPFPPRPICNDQAPCPDPNSYCYHSKCICDEGYSEPLGVDPKSAVTCVKTPKFGEPCEVNGQTLRCQYSYGMSFGCSPGGICACDEGFEPDPRKPGECQMKVRLVGDACAKDVECRAAFSFCENGKCACIDGFKSDGALCTPTEYHCHDTDKPLEENGKIRLCEKYRDRDTWRPGNDTCPPTHFCHLWQQTEALNFNLVGHCCPKQTDSNSNLLCPLGFAHETDKCPDLSQVPADGPVPPELGPFCDILAGYECASSVCCPAACRSHISGIYNVNGRCYYRGGKEKPGASDL